MEKNRETSRGHVSTKSCNRSMSDTDSQFDSFHSPLRSESPLRSDDLEPSPTSTAIVKYIQSTPEKAPSPVVVYTHRLVMEDVSPVGMKVPRSGDFGGGGDVEGEDGVGGERRSRAAVTAILRRSEREVMMKRAELGFRVCEAVLCLISFSVMVADKTQGWSGDSFNRYNEYRYCVAVTVIGFVYSGFQAWDLAYNLVTGKCIFSHHLRCHFDFAMDQILAYLLISASSSAATRVLNWVLNWGKDEFTEMASASIGMSFLAFGAFAFSSLISGYKLCNRSTS